MPTLHRTITLIIKVTNACNMHCKYCFIEPSVFHKKMKWETARRVIRSFLDSNYFTGVHFVWHGGEPLLRGRTFFEKIFAEQKARPTVVQYTNSIQTNATHLDDEFLNFLIANDVHIGLSLDGPKQANDETRKMRGGCSGSAFVTTVDAAQRLKAQGQSPGAIIVVHRDNHENPGAIYQTFKQQGINMKLNPLSKSGLAVAGEEDLGISAEDYGRFMVRLFDLWYDDPEPTIKIEPFGTHLARLLDVPGAVHDCHFARNCHRSFLGIAPDGDLYPCGMFQGEPAFKYGNLHEMAPEDIALTALFGEIEEREQTVAQSCAKCTYFDLCYSGCMFHSLKNAGRFEEKDYYCAGYKMYFRHLLERVHGELTEAKASLA